MKTLTNYFTKAELALWGGSTGLILLSVLICFAMFLVNDLYGFISWRRMEKRQLAA